MSVFPRPIPEAPKARPEHRHWVSLGARIWTNARVRNRTTDQPKPQPSPDNVLYGCGFRLGKEAAVALPPCGGGLGGGSGGDAQASTSAHERGDLIGCV